MENRTSSDKNIRKSGKFRLSDIGKPYILHMFSVKPMSRDGELLILPVYMAGMI